MAPTLKANRSTKTRRRTTRLRPLLEGLEDRRLPASLLVTSAADSGPGTLRDLIALANATTAPDEIRFQDGLPQIVLTSGTLSIASRLSIVGPVGGITIARSQAPGTPAFRVLQASDELDGPSSSQTFVRLENLTISGGIATDPLGGGGILNSGQKLTLVGSTVTGNASAFFGGGIRSISSLGSLTVQGSTIRANSAVLDGGGIFSNSPVTVTSTSIAGNSGRGGGGIGLNAPASIVNSSFSGNSATIHGGAILSLSNPTGQLSITASTLSGNSAPAGTGGGISSVVGPWTLANTIVAGNSGGELEGTMLGDHNLIGDASGGLDPSTNLLNVADPRLGPLQDNGGPTPTMALLPGSPAIDAGDNALAVDADGNPLPDDQRGAGHPRVINGTVDIGAFEFRNAATTTTLTRFAPSSTYGQRVTLIATVTADGTPQVEGTVTFLDGGVVLASGVPLDAGGQATFSTSGLDVTGSPHAITARYSGAPGAPASTSSALSIVITPAPLTAAVVVSSKRYDGTTAAAIVSAAPVGLIGDDQVGVTGGTATFDTRNAGTGKLVAVTGLFLNGPDAGNYALAGPVITSADVATLSITGIVTVEDRAYDATKVATIAGRSLIGVLGTDDVRMTGGTATFSDKNAGTGKTVTATGLTLTGADAGNYTVNTTATTAANILRLAITGGITASDKTYDGTTAATITGRTLSGVLAGDAVTYVGGKATFADRNVGAGKTVTATVLQLTGPDAGNYTVNATATTTASITPAFLNVTALGQNKVYDGTTATTVTLSDNRVAGDVLTLTYSAAAFSDPNAAALKIVNVNGIRIGGRDAGNYRFNASTTTVAAIFKANQTIVWSDPADIGRGTPLGPAQLNAVVVGVAGGTSPGALTFAPRAGTVLPVATHQALTVTAGATINYNAATRTVHINVLSAQQQVRALLQELVQVVSQGGLPQQFIQTAVVLLDIGQLPRVLAISRLQAFSQLVHALELSDILTEAQAGSLIRRADTLSRTLTRG